MNKFLYILFSLLLPLGAAAQSGAGSLRIDSLVMERVDGRLTVAFQAQADPATVPNGYTLLFTPVLQNGPDRVALPALYIQTRRAQKQAARNDFSFPDAMVRLSGAEPVDYYGSIPYEHWMRGAEFTVENTAFYCRAYADFDTGRIAEDLFAGDTTLLIRVIEPVVTERPETAGERLAEQWSFVAPLADFERAPTTSPSTKICRCSRAGGSARPTTAWWRSSSTATGKAR